MNINEADPSDVLNILIASDVHLGFEEKDPIRGEDSFQTLEEILTIAGERDVDIILLGGDLFHDAKPSQKCLLRSFHLFRRFCMGDRPVPIEFLSDQAENFKHCLNPVVNYEDPNINVSIPVFSIHGNHDDPTGLGRTSSLDLLSEAGLVNYFGKWTDLKQIEISPLLMRKGATKLALYGLSYIKDERLSRLFRDRKVLLYQPKEATEEWFNIFVLHQNRADRGLNNCLPEHALPKFLDIVVWGHEHECRIVPETNPIQGFSVIQPGSPVATSLCEGETAAKHVGILKIYKKEFEFEPIKLKTVRPFVMDTVVLSNTTINFVNDVQSEAVQDYLHEYITHMIERAKCLITGHRKQPVLPLIRLRVEYSNETQTFNPLQFGLRFNADVANPRDIVLLRKERKARGTKESYLIDEEAMNDIMESRLENVETVVEKYFSGSTDRNLQVLSVKGLNEAVSFFINKSDDDAISDLIKHQIEKTTAYLKANVNDVNEVEATLENYRIARSTNKDTDEIQEAKALLTNQNRSELFSNNANNEEIATSSGDEKVDKKTTSSSTPRGRGRGRGRGSRGGKEANTSTTSRTSSSRSTRGVATRGKKLQPLEVTQTSMKSFTRNKPSHQVMILSDSD